MDHPEEVKITNALRSFRGWTPLDTHPSSVFRFFYQKLVITHQTRRNLFSIPCSLHTHSVEHCNIGKITKCAHNCIYFTNTTKTYFNLYFINMPTSTSATEEKQYGRKTIPVLKATSSTARRRRRKHAIATVTAAAFCLSLPANINAFSVDFLTSTTVRGPLHKTLNNLSGGSIPTRTSLSAVTDPEVLLKDILEASSLSSKDNNENGNGKEQIRGQTNGKHQHANNGSDDGTRTRIQMNIQDLYRLESSYDLDCNQENTDAKHHSKNKEKLLSEIKSKTSPSSSTTSTKKRNSSPSERSIHDIAKKLSFSKRKPSARTATMPGFRNKKTSQRHQSFRDGLEIAKRSNTHMAGKIHSVLHSEKEQKKRRKENSEAMYRGSASVPDSLIAFTREIHMVS